jgi:GNAT superfamily N-acetyltransferase
MNTPVVRFVTPDDFEALVGLYSELTGGAPVLDGKDGEAKLAEILSHPGTLVFGVEVGGQIVSIATLHICPNLTFGGRSYARIENVVTSKVHRGLGLSRLVMQAAIKTAQNENVVSIILLTGKQLGARGFYEKLGFNGEDKWGMILRLDPTS